MRPHEPRRQVSGRYGAEGDDFKRHPLAAGSAAARECIESVKVGLADVNLERESLLW